MKDAYLEVRLETPILYFLLLDFTVGFIAHEAVLLIQKLEIRCHIKLNSIKLP
jgi:hypothetical protein